MLYIHKSVSVETNTEAAYPANVLRPLVILREIDVDELSVIYSRAFVAL